ncbi:hypothetical protein CBR_g34729 [Chara braunii]|uniref:Uncharacterized protein n=1 Tax=Chara braunii TaxID=69332 RepID=A0A388JYZ2_CHABU|nr:hypothetical protein CBR_g34729 [Chara braunii]|eukprot:GBG63029.1 hypothetical protein CBR_g34729 [Chara braunii]
MMQPVPHAHQHVHVSPQGLSAAQVRRRDFRADQLPVGPPGAKCRRIAAAAGSPDGHVSGGGGNSGAAISARDMAPPRGGGVTNEEEGGARELASRVKTAMTRGVGLSRSRRRRRAMASVKVNAKKKSNLPGKDDWQMFPDDYYDEELDYGEVLSTGKQTGTEPRPPNDPDSGMGFLDFPAYHLPEIASLGLKIRNDIRKLCCFVAGGVYENLLFFPIIELMKKRNPGVKVDVIASPRGKQTYELNKNVRFARAFDFEVPFISPDDYADMAGLVKSEVYDMMISTKKAGPGQAILMFLGDCRNRIAYVRSDPNGVYASWMLNTPIEVERNELADDGVEMYKELVEELDDNDEYVPKLQVWVPGLVRKAARDKYEPYGLKSGEFVVMHGLESTSKATMKSRGDPDSLLGLDSWKKIMRASKHPVLFVVPHDRDLSTAQGALGRNAYVIKITTPGQLAAVIDDSMGVVTTNTAAVQLAGALKKTSVAMFCSEGKAMKFVPDAQERQCQIVASSTGKLADVDIAEVITAMTTSFA